MKSVMKYLSAALVIAFVAACASTPDKPSTYGGSQPDNQTQKK